MAPQKPSADHYPMVCLSRSKAASHSVEHTSFLSPSEPPEKLNSGGDEEWHAQRGDHRRQQRLAQDSIVLQYSIVAKSHAAGHAATAKQLLDR